jgi:DnaJ-class molecular chaperone
MMREAVIIHVTHERPCRDCRGKGWNGKPLRAPDGTIPLRRVMAKVQCSACKGKGKILIGEEHHERGETRVFDYAR